MPFRSRVAEDGSGVRVGRAMNAAPPSWILCWSAVC